MSIITCAASSKHTRETSPQKRMQELTRLRVQACASVQQRARAHVAMAGQELTMILTQKHVVVGSRPKECSCARQPASAGAQRHGDLERDARACPEHHTPSREVREGPACLPLVSREASAILSRNAIERVRPSLWGGDPPTTRPPFHAAV